MNFQTISPSQILRFAIFGLLLCGSANLGLAQNNFKFTVQDKWPVSNKGYYRIKFELSDTLNAALTRDRQFNIVAAPQGLGSAYSPQDCISKKRVTIPAGTNLVEGEILVPVNSQAGNLVVFVDANDNLKLDDKELLYKEIDLTQTAPWNDFRILYVDNLIGTTRKTEVQQQSNRRLTKPIDYSFKKAPDEGPPPPNLEMLDVRTNAINSVLWLSELKNHGIAPADLPESWLGLSAIDILVIPESDLDQLFQQQKEKFEAIRKWIAYGGRLIVFRAKPNMNFESVEQIRSRIAGSTRPDWFVPIPPTRRSRYTGNRPKLFQKTSDMKLAEAMQGRSSSLTKSQIKMIESGQAPIGFDYGLGEVRITKSQITPMIKNNERYLVGISRLGSFDNMDRTNVLRQQALLYAIPGVGKPPIGTFQVLIILFVMVVGPITYAVLKRQKRIPLMYFVVPIISFLTCTGLVNFSLIYEGIAIRGRISSFTELDNNTGVAVTTTAHTFYSVLQPSGYSIENDTLIRMGSSRRSWLLNMGEENTRISGGNARSRSIHQLETVNIHNPGQGLEIIIAEGEPLSVVNRFDSRVEGALVAYRGKKYFIEGLEPGEKVTANKIGDVRELSNTCRDVTEPPISWYAKAQTNNMIWVNGGMMDLGEVSTNDRLRTLSDFMQYSGSRTVDDGQYIAVLKDWESVKEFDKSVRYHSKIHLVRGTFQ